MYCDICAQERYKKQQLNCERYCYSDKLKKFSNRAPTYFYSNVDLRSEKLELVKIYVAWKSLELDRPRRNAITTNINREATKIKTILFCFTNFPRDLLRTPRHCACGRRCIALKHVPCQEESVEHDVW